MDDLPKVGDRIRLIQMGADPCPIEPGSEGTVLNATTPPYSMGELQIMVKWDSGRTLSLVCPPDQFAVISDKEN